MSPYSLTNWLNLLSKLALLITAAQSSIPANSLCWCCMFSFRMVHASYWIILQSSDIFLVMCTCLLFCDMTVWSRACHDKWENNNRRQLYEIKYLSTFIPFRAPIFCVDRKQPALRVKKIEFFPVNKIHYQQHASTKNEQKKALACVACLCSFYSGLQQLTVSATTRMALKRDSLKQD